MEQQYFLLNDIRDHIKQGYCKNLLRDLKAFYPDEFETLCKDLWVIETEKRVAALLRSFGED